MTVRGLGDPPTAYSQVRGNLFGLGPPVGYRPRRGNRVTVEVKFVIPSVPGCTYAMDERKGTIDVAELLAILEPQP
jgi:hypothetical protein